MRVELKHSVVANILPEFAVGLGWIKALWEEENLGRFVITSLKDGAHRAGSQHKHDMPENVPGEAADIRTWHLFDKDKGAHKEELIAFARLLQRAGFRVVVHPDWVPGTPHLHVALGKAIFKRVD